jgi:hypothetical protein
MFFLKREADWSASEVRFAFFSCIYFSKNFNLQYLTAIKQGPPLNAVERNV